MLELLIWIATVLPCLLVSWVGGSYFLSLGRPQATADLLAMVSALAVAVTGIAVAFAPICGDGVPLAITLIWRLALAVAAAILYERRFGWHRLARDLIDAATAWRFWWCRYIELGRAAGARRERSAE